MKIFKKIPVRIFVHYSSEKIEGNCTLSVAKFKWDEQNMEKVREHISNSFCKGQSVLIKNVMILKDQR